MNANCDFWIVNYLDVMYISKEAIKNKDICFKSENHNNLETIYTVSLFIHTLTRDKFSSKYF